MSHGVCPWWLGYFLLNPLRRAMQNPEKILSPYVKEGMSVMDIGCGMGYFTLPLADLVGDKGQVLAVDLQPQMILSLERRAAKRGLSAKIKARICTKESLNINDYSGGIDFALAFAVVHEVPDNARLLSEIYYALKPENFLLLAEPSGHVSTGDWDKTTSLAQSSGFVPVDYPEIRGSRAVLLAKFA